MRDIIYYILYPIYEHVFYPFLDLIIVIEVRIHSIEITMQHAQFSKRICVPIGLNHNIQTAKLSHNQGINHDNYFCLQLTFTTTNVIMLIQKSVFPIWVFPDELE